MSRALGRVTVLLLALVPALAGWVAIAAVDPGFVAQAAVALAAFCSAAWLFLGWLERRRPDPLSGRARLVWIGGGAIAYAATAQVAVGRPPTRALDVLVPPRGIEYAQLADGARLAFRRFGPSPGENVETAGRATVVWLHDGPGLPILPMIRDDAPRPLRSAAEEGFTVVFYDQRGAGLSDRYDLRRGGPYTVAGHVADLEEMRTILGAERLILAGHGWGASLAAEYLLAHPDRVERMILFSPAPLWYPAWEDFVAPSARARISEVQASALALLERPTPRLVVGRLTASASRSAAHGLVPDWEADQWWTDATREAWRLGQPKPTCTDRPPGGFPPLEGLGYFAYSYTVDDALARPDPRPALGTMDIPVLLMRGLCDWVTSEVANEYLEVLPGAQYVAVPGAGHVIWLEMVDLQEQVVADFLAGRPVPLAFFNPR